MTLITLTMTTLKQSVLTVGLLILHLDFCLVLHPPVITSLDSRTFDEGTQYYRLLHFDRNNNLYVGAMEHVYRLNTNDISNRGGQYKKSSPLPVTDLKKNRCASRKPDTKDFDCRNHIRTIVVSAEDLYVCGTGAFEPQEFQLRKSDLGLMEAGTPDSGRAKCPYSPNDSSACVYVLHGNPQNIPSLYAGTVAGFDQNDPLIFRPPLLHRESPVSPLLRTVPVSQNVNWLQDVTFIGAFETNDHVFFFLREAPVEYPNMDIQLSRIARVCKNDRGGRSVLSNIWTTYVKARLNCSLPGMEGQMPFYFDEIRDVQKIENTFYGVFSTKLSKSSGLYGSAVCSFSLDDIDATFKGAFKESQHDGRWVAVPENRVPEDRPGDCHEDSQNLNNQDERFIKSHPLLDQAVPHEHGVPLFHQQNTVYEKLAIDRVSTPRETYTVFFLATDQGEIHKVVQWRDGATIKNQVVSIWKPFGDFEVKIWSMELRDQYLYLGTDDQVVQLALHQCDRYKLCTDCVQDPYCGWNKNINRCDKFDITRSSFNESSEDQYTQSVGRSALAACTNAGVCFSGHQTVRVRVAGDAVRLDCNSLCESHNGVKWQFSNSPIMYDNRKYLLTQENGLVIWNVTKIDEGEYVCVRDDSRIAEYTIQLPGCTDPDCVWQEEFREWCDEFEKYRQEFNHWQCMKSECLQNEQHCNPNAIPADRCPAPFKSHSTYSRP